MKMQIGRWGNSLAVRLPKVLVERFGLKEGDEIDSESVEAALGATLSEEKERRRAEALDRIRNTRMSLPPDWKFERDEANWRPAMDRW
jgi:antitoxin MazE